MKKAFFEEGFDDGTALKLSVFRGYIREWVSLFMNDSDRLAQVKCLNIFDLFAGPGGDAVGHSGSPLIIQQEIKRYCEEHDAIKSSRPLTM